MKSYKKSTLAIALAMIALVGTIGIASAAPSQKKVTSAPIDAKTKTDNEIDKRVVSLNELLTNIQSIRNLTDGQRTALLTTVQGEIAELNTLKSKIANDTEASTTKADMQSLTKSYRVYALVIPEIRIIISADRTVTTAFMLNVLGSKLQSRLAAAPDITASTTLAQTLTDMSQKIADATSQAQAAVNTVVPLAPDNGDKDIMKSNTAALKDAQSKLKTAKKYLETARKDADTIIKALKKYEKAHPVTPASNTGSTTPVTP